MPSPSAMERQAAPAAKPTTTQTYVVEKVDPSSTHPHLTDETFECGSVTALADRLDDLMDMGRALSREVAKAVVDNGRFEWTDPETGVEVRTRVVEGVR